MAKRTRRKDRVTFVANLEYPFMVSRMLRDQLKLEGVTGGCGMSTARYFGPDKQICLFIDAFC